ncbi:MAG: radical SAM family heme chaperone HemW [Gemmatimonadota bacterium]|nr:radical SAM family heme chaperone HemW [Gemmatimonadota bacterium]
MRPTPVGAVYVHAPFCARRCVYCDFAVKVRAEGGPEAWWEAISGELDHVRRSGRFLLNPELSSLYVGGGTPSLLGPRAMSGLADILGPRRLAHGDLEWTAEANPESFDEDVARGWRAAGVNRLSLGVQTFHESALRWMGRLHGSEGGPRAVATARREGIENVSIDLIFGLPAHLGRSWSEDLARAVDLGVPHVSLYGLTVEPDTALGRAVAEGRESVADEDRYAEEFLEAAEVLTRAGYHHYEVSNFAWPAYEARHNATYWSGAPYLGLGNGAHSYAPPIRAWNVREWDEYLKKVRVREAPEADHEVLDASAMELERIWLRLRTSRGIEAPLPGTRRAHLVDDWVEKGLADTEGGHVRLNARGWLLLDRLAVEYTG